MLAVWCSVPYHQGLLCSNPTQTWVVRAVFLHTLAGGAAAGRRRQLMPAGMPGPLLFGTQLK